jgi:DNA-binding transcriptional ArsR family regulator
VSSKRPDAFSALADPTRRSILELLRDQPSLNAGEIAASYPYLSRPAVSKHLRVLRRARLVRAHSRGREVHYRLNSVPLASLADWLAEFADHWEQNLEQLKQQAEESTK